MTNLPAEHEFAFALQATKRRVKLVTLSTAGFVWLAAAVTWLLLFVVCDHWVPGGVPDQAHRLTGGLFLLASGIWLTVAGVLPLVRRINDLYVARLIEHAHPEFRNSLVDAIQIAHRSDLPGSVQSAVLIRAGRDVVQVDPRRSVSSFWLRVAAVVNAAALALFGLYAMVAPKPVMASIRRAFGSALAAPTRTRMTDLTPEDGASVLRGQPVTFGVRLQGDQPESAYVRFSFDGSSTWLASQRLPLTRSDRESDGTRWQAIKAARDVQRPMAWQVIAGDAGSEVRRLQVRPAPEITAINVRCVYPNYTRLLPTTQPAGEIDAVVGTRVAIEASSNVPAYDPVLVLGRRPAEKRRLLTRPPPGKPHQLSAQLTVVADDQYRLEFRDAHGEPNRNAIGYPIRAHPDEPPTVRVAEPGPDIEMLATDVLPLAASVEDDFGLTRLALSCRHAGQRVTREVALPPEMRKAGRAAQVREQVPLSQMNARPGDVIEWWISAWDNREDAAGRPAHQQGDSDVRRITIREPDVVAQEGAVDDGQAEASEPGADVGTVAGVADGDAHDRLPSDSAPAEEMTKLADGDDTRSDPAVGEPADDESRRGASREFASAHQRELETLAKYLLDDAGESSDSAGREPDRGTDELGSGRDGQEPKSQQHRGEQDAPRLAGEQGSENHAARDASQQVGDKQGAQQGSGEQGAPRPADEQGLENDAARNGPQQAPDKRDPQQGGDEQALPQGPGQEGLQRASDKQARPADDPEQASPQDEPQNEHDQPPQQLAGGQGAEQVAGEQQPQLDGTEERASGQSGGEGQVPAENDGDGEGQGSGQGEGKGQGEVEGTGESEGEGQGLGQGTGKGQGSGQSDGEGAGESEGEGQGSGQGKGQGSGQSDGEGTGESEGKGQGSGQSQGKGQGSGQGEGEGAGEGEGQGSGQGGGKGRGSGQGGGGDQPSVDEEAEPTTVVSVVRTQTGGSAVGSGGGPQAGGGAERELPQEAEQPDTATTKPVEGPTRRTGRLMPPGRVARVMDELERSLRSGEVDEEMLDELDWNLPHARQFVENYKHIEAREHQPKQRTEVPTRTIESQVAFHGDGKVHRAEHPRLPGMRSLNATGQHPPDTTRGLMQVGRQRILPRYESLLQAYYASVASQPAE